MQDFSRIDVDVLNKKEAKKLLVDLMKEIQQHNDAYFLYNNPKISDAQYDLLVNAARTITAKFPDLLEKSNPIDNIATDAKKGAEKIKHMSPMLSLSNAFSTQDIKDFIERVQNFLQIDYFPKICAELKVDGASFSVVYKNGVLDSGATRGDGLSGEDITHNIKSIPNLPHKVVGLPDVIELRGEVFIYKEDFITLNKKQNKIQNTFSNPRNFAAGSLRHIKEHPALKLLRYIIYGVGFNNAQYPTTQIELLNFLAQKGFQINQPYACLNNLNDMSSFYHTQMDSRDNLPYEIDGVVYKINDFTLQKRYKFPETLALTQLLDLEIQLGRTGAITPIAVLDKIPLGGAYISRASLHNFHYIQKKDIRIGDYVYLKRAGDVIPYVSKVDLAKRNSKKVKKITVPTHCPECNNIVHLEEDNAILRCLNSNCLGKRYHRIIHFVSSLDIYGIKYKQLQKLQKLGFVESETDLFKLHLHKEKLIKIEGLGVKTVENILEQIESARYTTLDKFISALGIRHLGTVVSQTIASECKTAEELSSLLQPSSEERILKYTSVDGIGSKAVESLQDFANNKQNVERVLELIQLMQIQPYTPNTINSRYQGLKLVFTGNLQDISRAEAKEQAKKLGIKVISQLSSNTDMLVCGDKPGSKLKKAKELGIKVINIAEWKQMLYEIE